MNIHSPLAPIVQKLLELTLVAWRGNDQYVINSSHQQRTKGVVNHRFIIDRHQLLAYRGGKRK